MNTAEKIYHDVQDFTQAAIKAGEHGEYETVTLEELKKQRDEA